MPRVFVANAINDMNMGALQQWGSPVFLFDGPVVERSGECMVVSFDGGRSSVMAPLVVARAGAIGRVKTFNPEVDFLALAGCPAHYSWVVYALCNMGVAPKLLKWNGKSSCYYPVRLEG